MTRVLVIDDDFQNRAVLRQMLEREGYDVIDAGDGASGLRAYAQAPAELVITDIIMPEREGLEIIQTFRQRYPAVKIIAISGGSPRLPADFLSTAALLGAHRTLAKPIRRIDLLVAVHELLGDRPANP
ncbi:MAG: response regulator [Candidatus Tectimicrobiota bacterium]